MSMDMFDNILENIDENYPFTLSHKLILAILITVGICVIALGIIFIWYKRKTTLSSSTMENLIKFVPSLLVILPHWTLCCPYYQNVPLLELKLEPHLLLFTTSIKYQDFRLPLHLNLPQLCLNQYTLSKDQFTRVKEQNILLKRRLLSLFHWKCLTRLLLT